jgi:adenylate cyclase
VTEERAKRKLSAILSADVKGYSRLMGDDELATVRTLEAYRKVITEVTENYRGRVVDSPGDNVLAEFGSIVDAVESAVEIQKRLKIKNDELDENRKMEFRIGINLGDVIAEGDRIYGDGVNIAARVEGLAEGGGICISGTAYDQIKNKLNLDYESLGEHSVKNIVEPIRVYRLSMTPKPAETVTGEERPKPKTRRWAISAAILAIIVVAGTLLIWNFYFRPDPSSKKPSSVAITALPLSGRASIAVLPFKNLSKDPEQEYFSEGITNDIITDLSKFKELLVIASNTVFTYKGKSVNVKDVSQELGVRYVLEGSVQKLKNQLRINAQLIDGTTGHHLWAERFDRHSEALFEVQDEIVQTIVTMLAIKVDEAERVRAMRKDTENLEAYDYALRGEELLLKGGRSGTIKAKEMFRKAIELDSHYALAYVGLGWAYYIEAVAGWTEFPVKAMEKALSLGQQAMDIIEADADVHALLGSVNLRLENYDLAINQLNRAIELNPNHALSHLRLGTIMLFVGRAEEAIQLLEAGLRYHPHTDPDDYGRLALAYYIKGNYDDVIRMLQKDLVRSPKNPFHHIILAAAYAQENMMEEANRSAETVMNLYPFFEVDSSFTLFRNPEDRKKIIEGLRKAGFK